MAKKTTKAEQELFGEVASLESDVNEIELVLETDYHFGEGDNLAARVFACRELLRDAAKKARKQNRRR